MQNKYNLTLSFNVGVAFDTSIEAALLYDELSFLSTKGIRKDGWIWKTDDELVERMPFSKKTVRRSITKLLEAGYIEKKLIKANGAPTNHYRVVKTMQPFNQQIGNGQSDQMEMPKVTKSYTATHTQQLTTLTKVNGVTTYGNVDINTVMDDLYGGIGLKPIKVKQQRIAASNLIKRHGLENTRKLIKIALQLQETDTYASRITSMQDLWNKQNNILVSIKKNNSNQINNQIRSV